jgi:AraC-like DNA-binding protein
MHHAKRLLLETALPIRAIAERVGHARQHEFTRAFHRELVCSPTWWRAHGGDPRHHRDTYR